MTDPRLRAGLLQIYSDLAQDIAQRAPVCDLSGRCCRFKEYGHRLYLSRPEAELLLEKGLPAGAQVDDAGCPFQVGQLCTARELRPFGCRVYFCDPSYTGQAEELTETYLTQLKSLHRETDTPWDYAELSVFLLEHQAAQASISNSTPENETVQEG
jgi:Fe-S-cluster containining protein